MNPKYTNIIRKHLFETEPEFIKNVASDLDIDIKDISIDTVKMTNHETGTIDIKNYVKIQDECIVITGHEVINER